ncbi:tetratricopeptide repeat protein [Roseateles paludis]|uniref:ABC transporter permease n=1 Tax=Roseateles paludis TaxID=3145238 RepID=A0ABV0G002_9BURK
MHSSVCFPLKAGPVLGALVLALLMPAAFGQAAKINSAEEERECGPLVSTDTQLLPPKDYRTDRAWLSMVEGQHFPPEVENLVKPKLSTFGAAIAYTLHGYPNHVRALATLERLTEREKTDQPKGAQYSLDCYYRRAIRFVPNDLLVRMMYAMYLHKRGKVDLARSQAEFVDESAGNDPLTRNNLGLVFLQLNLPERAREQLGKADAEDPAMQALRRRLAARDALPSAASGVPLGQ